MAQNTIQKMAPIIEAKGLEKWYSGVHALKAVDFHVDKGEIVGLVGDNGAGKTTLIKVLSGVHRPDGGQVFIEGKPVDIATPKQAMDLGIETIYQTNSMVPTMSIARNLFVGREPLTTSVFGIGLMSTCICAHRTPLLASCQVASARAWRLRGRCISSQKF
jgi:simple sugar transport system ATP-binding protein